MKFDLGSISFSFSDVLAGLAFLLSFATFYFVYLKRGKIMMTKPAQIWFGTTNDKNSRPFVFVKTLLYSTSLRGQIIETMYATVTRNETTQVFNIWAIGFGSNQSQLGGLKVHSGGTFTDNVFISPNDGSKFSFLEGDYRIEIFARTVGKRQSIKLDELVVTIPNNFNTEMKDDKVLQFYLQSNGTSYHCSEGEIPRDLNLEFLEKFSQMMTAIESDKELKALEKNMDQTAAKRLEK